MTGRVVLGIDTCTRWLNLALVDGTGTVLEEYHREVPTHTTHLVPAIDAFFSGGGPGHGGLEAVGAVIGPGSFTGLRVGLAAALGLRDALGVPVFGLDALTALAASCGAEGEGVALLDARRSQVYACRFLVSGGEFRRLCEPRAVAPLEVLRGGFSPSWAAGDGVPLVPAWPPGCSLFPGIPNLAVPAAREALRCCLAGEPSGDLRPLYVRPPDARKPL